MNLPFEDEIVDIVTSQAVAERAERDRANLNNVGNVFNNLAGVKLSPMQMLGLTVGGVGAAIEPTPLGEMAIAAVLSGIIAQQMQQKQRGIPLHTLPPFRLPGTAIQQPNLQDAILGGEPGGIPVTDQSKGYFYPELGEALRMPQESMPLDQIKIPPILMAGMPVRYSGGDYLNPSTASELISQNPQAVWMLPQLQGFLKGKVAQGEIDMLQGLPQKFTKEQALSHIEGKIPQIEVVEKGGKIPEDILNEISQKKYDVDYSGLSPTNKQYVDWEAQNRQEVKTKFSQYQLPGGENYREVLIKVPQGKTLTSEFKRVSGKGYLENWSQEDLETYNKLKSQNLPEEYQSSHYPDDKGTAGWNRYTDYKTPDGKRILFLQESQDVMSEADKEAAKAFINKHFGSRTKFTEIRMRQFLEDAKEGNYDGISWTTGQQQADRYDLSKQVSKVEYERLKDGAYHIRVYPKRGDFQGYRVDTDKELSTYVGKDLAEKIANNKSSKETYSGLDLKIGGEWAKNLYDQQLPNILKDLTKKEVGEIGIGTPKEVIVSGPGGYAYFYEGGELMGAPEYQSGGIERMSRLPVREFAEPLTSQEINKIKRELRDRGAGKETTQLTQPYISLKQPQAQGEDEK